ncbi:MAG: hypothetical protein MRZ79_20620 [Bacteroidia bacterium]|nr:hypothetical protein [Bacteroidia bacterium]
MIIRAYSFICLLILCFIPKLNYSQDNSHISLNLGTSEDDKWQFAGNIKLNKEIRRMGENFSTIEVVKLRNDDKLLEEEVKNFVAPAVPLLDFSAKWNFGNIAISWITPALKSRKSITLQKSTNGINWIDVYVVREEDKSMSRSQYLDSSLQIGTNIYRLKQINTNNKIAYSNHVAVEVLPELIHTTYLYPNPLIFGTLIELELFKAAEVEIKVLSEDYKELAIVYSELCSMGKHFVELNMDGLPKGKYLCSITSGGKTAYRVLQR